MEKKRCFGCMQQKRKAVCEHCGYDEKRKNAAHQLQTGTILNGQYVLGRVLGQSRTDIQYLAWDTSLNSPVVIKEYYPEGFVTRSEGQEVRIAQDTPDAYETYISHKNNFINETKLIARFSIFAEIAPVRNRFQEKGTEYVVTEYIQGTSLREYVHQHGTLSLDDILVILQPVMKLLAQTHVAGLIHQNISPDNILLLPKGGVKLLDFGSPRNLECTTRKSIRKTPQTVSLSGFAPAEQYQHSFAPGPWTDVYGICSTIYFCLTGKVPADALSRTQTSQEIDWHPLEKKLSACQLNTLCAGMELKPQNRPQTMAQLYQGLLGYDIPLVQEGADSYTSDPTDPDATMIMPRSTRAENAAIRTSSVSHSEIPKAPRKNFPIIPALLVFAVIIIAGLTAFFFTYHIWTEPDCASASVCRICGKTGTAAPLGHHWQTATCTTPDTCTRCGVTSGEALGHAWQAATCETAKFCSNCGQEDGIPLGHEWREATYTEPKVCTRCALTEGNTKGYIGKVNGTWSDEHFYHEGTSTSIFELEQTIENCKQLTLSIGVSNVQFGSIYGEWLVFGRDLYGSWNELGAFTLTADELSIPFEFEVGVNFDAVAVFPREKHYGNFSKWIALSEVQVYVD